MRKNNIFPNIVLFCLALLCVIPFLYIIFLSLEPNAYYEVFLSDFKYLSRFWTSIIMCTVIVLLNLTISCLAAFSFAKYNFKLKNFLYFVLIIIMIMPLQVTIVPTYTILQQLGLLNSYSALILPSVFMPLGTFILTQCFKAVPNEVMESARLDGANTVQVITKIFAPINKSGLVCVSLLVFMDNWNMTEQPVAFLSDYTKFPLSVVLVYLPPDTIPAHLASCILAILPVLYLFLFFNKQLIEGISLSQVKG